MVVLAIEISLGLAVYIALMIFTAKFLGSNRLN